MSLKTQYKDNAEKYWGISALAISAVSISLETMSPDAFKNTEDLLAIATLIPASLSATRNNPTAAGIFAVVTAGIAAPGIIDNISDLQEQHAGTKIEIQANDANLKTPRFEPHDDSAQIKVLNTDGTSVSLDTIINTP